MSRINKQKHVRMNEMGDGDFDPPGVNQQFARVVKSRGNNLHEVEPAEPIVVTPTDDADAAAAADAEPELTFLASMPPKFRKNIWIKRGNFVIVEMIAEGNKVKAEIARILLPEHVREFKKDGIWPAKFDVQPKADEVEGAVAKPERRDSDGDSGADDDESDDDDADLVRNTNGWHAADSDESDDSEESSSEEEEEEEEEVVEEKSVKVGEKQN